MLPTVPPFNGAPETTIDRINSQELIWIFQGWWASKMGQVLIGKGWPAHLFSASTKKLNSRICWSQKKDDIISQKKLVNDLCVPFVLLRVKSPSEKNNYPEQLRRHFYNYIHILYARSIPSIYLPNHILSKWRLPKHPPFSRTTKKIPSHVFHSQVVIGSPPC